MTPQSTDSLKPHVLVVDDESQLVVMVAGFLRESGFNISTAENAADAYNLLQQEPYDAILTDVMMPGEDGVTFLGRVHKAWPDLPVILMTGYAQLQMAIDAIKNGAFDFIHKPYDITHLGKIVERAVNYTKLLRMENNYRAELEETVTCRTTELKNAMIELDCARSALLKSASERNEFMSNISHEMRTPMNGIIGGLSLLEEEVTTAEGKCYFAMVQQSANSMVALINQLLVFARGVNQGGGAVHCDLISIVTELDDLMAKYRSDFDLRGISLTLNIAPAVPCQIWADKRHLNSLLGLLLGNALKFTDKGAVTLEVSKEDNGDEHAFLIFDVTDTGIGVPGGMLERIFEPFVQGDGSLTRRHGGVGLGLAIARQYSLILNGRLWAEHVPGGGSSFKFRMKEIIPEEKGDLQ